MKLDPISRIEAIDLIRSLSISIGGKEIFHPEAKKSVIDALDTMPELDALPVVRCNKCIRSAIDGATGRLMCVRMGEIRPNGHVWGGTAVDENHFCGYGAKEDKPE